MYMYNKLNLKEDFVVDMELLRIEKLIEQREAYEERFFSLEPNVDEFEHIISQYNQELENQENAPITEYFEDDLSNPFEFEDRQNQLRDEKLIKEREEYESSDFLVIDDYFASNDIYDFQIAKRQEEEFLEINEYDYDFEYEPEDYEDYGDYNDYEYYQYEEEMFWTLHYLKQSQFEAPKCNCVYMDYMPNDDGLCDYLDCYDYPEGPDENLSGIKYF